MQATAARLPLRLSLIYAAVAGTYIVVSDRVLATLAPGAPYPTTIQTAKGVAFVVVTAALVYVLARRTTRAANYQSAARERSDEVRVSLDRRNEAFVKALGEVVYDHNVTRDHIDWGGDTVRSLGSTLDELGHSVNGWLGRVHPDDQQRVSDEFQRPGSALFNVEYRMRHGAGHYVWMFDRGVITRDAEQRITRVTGVMWDITERRLAADALQQRLQLERQLSRLAASAPGVIHTFRLDPDGSMSMPYASAELERMTGLTPSAVAASIEPLFAGIHPDDLEMVHASIRESARTMELWCAEFRAGDPPRTGIWIEGRSAPVLEPDGAILWHGFFNDITSRKQLEEQLRQAQKMEAIGQLAAGVAHDFNNLLTIVIGYSDLLLTQLPADDPSRESVDEIRRAGERSAALTRQLLAFGRKQVLAPQVLDVNDLIRSTDKMLRHVLGEESEFTTRLADDTDNIRADPGQFEQLLLNLVVNAKDAMPNGGCLTIETANDRIDGQLTHDAGDAGRATHVRVSVTDTGTGMTDDVKRHLFEPFFTTKATGKGTGLGLAVAHGFITQSGGHIAVVSDLGRGTTFHMYFPRVDRAASDIA